MIDQESAINSVTDRIINNTFALKPISSILLQGSVVDEKRMIYRGVDVFVVPDIPPEIGVKYTCTYMDPVDELVLSALGLVLLNSYFPNLVQEKMIKEFFNDIESNENVKELIVFDFERGCSSSKTNSSFLRETCTISWYNQTNENSTIHLYGFTLCYMLKLAGKSTASVRGNFESGRIRRSSIWALRNKRCFPRTVPFRIHSYYLHIRQAETS